MTTNRVEWTVLSGEETETLLSVLLYSQHQRAVRVRPSRGDGGVDVLVPSRDQPGKSDVYQIKNFAKNLTSGQKGQIEHSYQRLMLQVAEAKVEVAKWYLLMPLDPTPENRTWFESIPVRAIERFEQAHQHSGDVPDQSITDDQLARIRAWQNDPASVIEWKGLIVCESLAASFPNVVDYYRHGGRDRVESAVRDVASLLSADRDLHRDTGGPDVQPADLREHLRTVQAVLDTDPHFRYGMSLDPNPPPLGSEPGLIAVAQEIRPDGQCLTFRIFPRYDEALHERPVPLHLTFELQDGTEESESFALWQKYGKPVRLSARFAADLPGGLGETETTGTVIIGPAADREPFRLRHRLVSPEGQPLAELILDMEPPSTGVGGTGMWSRGADSTGTVQVESLFDLETGASQFNVRFRTLAGTPVTEALIAGEFLAHWQAGNRIEIAREVGPFSLLLELGAGTEALIDQYPLRLLRALGTIQERLPRVIHVPDFTQTTRTQARDLTEAAALISGQTLDRTWQDRSFTPRVDAVADDQELEILVLENYRIEVDGATDFLGVATTHLPSARIIKGAGGYLLKPHRNDTAQVRLDVNATELSSRVPNVRSRPVVDP